MRTIILDSGAFIAAERRDRRLAALLAAAKFEDAPVLLPASVIVEIWRDPPMGCSTQLMSEINEVVRLGEGRAKRAGVLPHQVGSTQVVDAIVAIIAVDVKPSLIVTSDPTDLLRLIQAAGASCAINQKSGPRVEVNIETV